LNGVNGQSVALPLVLDWNLLGGRWTVCGSTNNADARPAALPAGLGGARVAALQLGGLGTAFRLLP